MSIWLNGNKVVPSNATSAWLDGTRIWEIISIDMFLNVNEPQDKYAPGIAPGETKYVQLDDTLPAFNSIAFGGLNTSADVQGVLVKDRVYKVTNTKDYYLTYVDTFINGNFLTLIIFGTSPVLEY